MSSSQVIRVARRAAVVARVCALIQGRRARASAGPAGRPAGLRPGAGGQPRARDDGSGEPSPGAMEAPAGLGRVWAALVAVPREHALFCSMLLVAVIVRVIVVLGYPPALWFDDSLPYVRAALRLSPYRVRPVGYSFFLASLEPFHSVWLVTATQASMGLAMGIAVYVLLRRHGMAGWAASLAAAPVLVSAYELQMEHFVLSDTLFGLLVTIAVVMVLWRPVPPVWVCALVGLVLAWAALDREQGVLLAIPFGLGLCTQLARRVSVPRLLAGITAMFVTLAVSVSAYGWWFDRANGSFGLTSSTGVFLYSRVSTFAECSVMKPPADERWLCIPAPPAKRPDPNFYAWSATSPINVRPPGGSEVDSRVNSLATNFALRAIEAQPAAYLTAVWQSITENFELQLMDSEAWFSQRNYEFPPATPMSLRAFAGAKGELPYYRDGYAYDGGRDPSTRMVRPFAGWIRYYQRFVVLPGPLLALIVLAGLTGIALAWRSLGDPALLPWLTGMVLIVTPAATTGYGARYLLASIPAFCIAGAFGVQEISNWVEGPAGATTSSTDHSRSA
jgi:hypothetical protein